MNLETHANSGSAIPFGQEFVEVTARLHSFVQDTNDLDDTFLGNAIVENVNRPSHLRGFGRMAAFKAPPIAARCKDGCEIDLRRTGKPKPRH